MVSHVCSPRTQKAKVGWWWVLGQPGLYSKEPHLNTYPPQNLHKTMDIHSISSLQISLTGFWPCLVRWLLNSNREKSRDFYPRDHILRFTTLPTPFSLLSWFPSLLLRSQSHLKHSVSSLSSMLKCSCLVSFMFLYSRVMRHLHIVPWVLP